jgi:hypothetical protein
VIDVVVAVVLIAAITASLTHRAETGEQSWGSAAVVWGLGIRIGIPRREWSCSRRPADPFVRAVGAVIETYGMPGVVGIIGGVLIGSIAADRAKAEKERRH